MASHSQFGMHRSHCQWNYSIVLFGMMCMKKAGEFCAFPWALIAILILLAGSSEVRSQAVDNGIIGEPEIKCGSEVVDLQFRTMKPFRGKVFVKGHYSDPNCKVDYTEAGGVEKPNGGIVIHHGACDMQRQRMINPQGMQFSSVIVISFHSVFITKLDKAYHIKCMYRELDKAVTNGLEVSAMTTALIAHTMPMPQCTYTIRKDEIDGEILKYARVGEQVVHRWQCDTEMYGILVHSCYVEDGQGEKVTVVDENGCHTDRYVLGDPTYVEKLNMAYRESHVFKFADKVAIRFQCQIRLCLKMDDGCKGITPPICASPIDTGSSGQPNSTQTTQTSSTTATTTSVTAIVGNLSSVVQGRAIDRARPRLFHRYQRAVTKDPDQGKYDGRLNFDPVDGDFTSQYIYVLDSTENPEKGYSHDKESSWSRFFDDSGLTSMDLHDTICISTITYGLLVAIITLLLMSATLATCVIIYQRARRHLHEGRKDRSLTGILGSIVHCGGGASSSRRPTSPGTTCSSVLDSNSDSGQSHHSYAHLVSLWNRGGQVGAWAK